jgi:ABC-type polysaccharide/polyol phosphate transport system ATPase subunit
MAITDTNLAISVDSVSLCFHIKKDRATSLKEIAVRKLLFRPNYENCFWALQDVSFTVERGERLGLIGLNGSGKTTLLSLVAGIYRPDKGNVTTQGRIVGLLRLGAGFDKFLTGRENIFLNASLYGLSRREIETQVNDIISFADIGEFIDQPVNTYSSGMQARLGFAVAAHLRADIILLDEVLAVGDAQFKLKCLARMKELIAENRTMLFVAHDMGAVREMCHKVIWLEHGRIIAAGPVEEIADAYEEKYIPAAKRKTLPQSSSWESI